MFATQTKVAQHYLPLLALFPQSIKVSIASLFFLLTLTACSGGSTTAVETVPGLAGPIGAQGQQGVPGLQGIQGLTGNVGTQGEKGATGATGPQGPAGPSTLPIAYSGVINATAVTNAQDTYFTGINQLPQGMYMVTLSGHSSGPLACWASVGGNQQSIEYWFSYTYQLSQIMQGQQLIVLGARDNLNIGCRPVAPGEDFTLNLVAVQVAPSPPQ
jgi:hypothetical protein